MALRLRQAPPITSVLVIEDNAGEAQRIAVMVRIVLGDAVAVHIARKLVDAKKHISAGMPDIIFLDDRLGHAVTAETSLAQLKTYGVTRLPIVMSGLLTRVRQVELRKLGVADILHKDDIDAARVMQAILNVFETETGDGQPEM